MAHDVLVLGVGEKLRLMVYVGCGGRGVCGGAIHGRVDRDL